MNTYNPTIQEFTEMSLIVDLYKEAKENKQYELSDKLRKLLDDSGFIPPKYEQYLPVFESKEHRTDRLAKRVINNSNH